MLLGRLRLRIVVVCCLGVLAFLLQPQPVASFIARLPTAAAARAGLRRQPPSPLLLLHHRQARGLPTMASSSTNGGVGDACRAILLLSTTEDKASVNLVNALLQRGGWEPHDVAGLSEGRVWRRPGASKPTYLWQIEQGFLRADFLDRRWTTATKEPLQEIIYLSRHAAASGKPSLTIHPIGNPGQPLPAAGADSAERAEHGGIPGKCVPPSPRMAPLFRLLHAAVRGDARLAEEFEVTLEATHHGPWHADGVPCCFVEIGSKDEDWGREDAAEVWAGVLERSLGLAVPAEGSSSTSSGGSSDPAASLAKPKAMVVGLGGGHYVPKMNDLLRHRDDVLIGHMCAGYCFNGAAEEWQAGVLEAVAASKVAVPASAGDVPVVVYVDKKAFKAAQRNDLMAFLQAQGLPYGVKESELVEAAERVGSAQASGRK